MATRKKVSSTAASTRRTKTDTNATVKGVSRSRVRKILDLLGEEYPEVECPLAHSNPLELLIATILSAQCTDARVNQVTPELFKKYRKAQDWANADQETLEQQIKSTGFFRNKAKAIRNCCTELIERFDGEIPDNIEDLSSLPGVGRKTANVVLGYAFGLPAIMVDTHAKRVSGRLGLTEETDPVKIEFDLTAIIPEKERTPFSHRIIQHGRRICRAGKPRCAECRLFKHCSFPSKS